MNCLKYGIYRFVTKGTWWVVRILRARFRISQKAPPHRTLPRFLSVQLAAGSGFEFLAMIGITLKIAHTLFGPNIYPCSISLVSAHNP
jgi:hypothetical protein